MIPKPFTRVCVAYGDPIYLDAPTPRDAAQQGERFEDLMEQTGATARV